MKCKEIERRFMPKKAFNGQRIIAKKVIIEDKYTTIRTVVGLDVAYKRISETTIGIGVAVALSYPNLKPIECIAALREVCIPYIPGLLAFREMAVLAPALLQIKKRIKPDLIIVDGHGIAHPRRSGIATHVGVVFNLPSIGVAKKRLYGKEVSFRGRDYLVDDNGVPIAAILRRGRGKIYVSPGHRVSVNTSARLIESMLKRGKLPEPTRIADHISKFLKKNINYNMDYYSIYGIKYIQCLHSNFGSRLF